MTESEAIEALTNEIFEGESSEGAEPQNDPQNEPQNEPQAKEGEQSAEPTNSELMAELRALREANAGANTANGAEANVTKEQPPIEFNLANKEALDELGLGEMAEQLQGGLEFLEQQKKALAEQQETARLTAVFEGNIKKFKEAFPTIKPDELYNFIKDNGYQDLLSEDYRSFELIGNAMINLAKNSNRADDITPSSGNSGKKSAFERLRDKEEVSDLEIGAELLEL